jgi:ATP phosphoribosyltransferase
MMYRNLAGGQFIWNNQTTTFLLERDKVIADEVALSGPGSFGLVGSDVLSERPASGLTVETLESIVNDRAQKLRFALATRAVDLTDIWAKINQGEPLCIATSYPKTATRELSKIGITAVMNDRTIRPGNIEPKLWTLEDEVDAIFELVQSGDSLNIYEATPVIDNILAVNLTKVNMPISDMNGGLS